MPRTVLKDLEVVRTQKFALGFINVGSQATSAKHTVVQVFEQRPLRRNLPSRIVSDVECCGACSETLARTQQLLAGNCQRKLTKSGQASWVNACRAGGCTSRWGKRRNPFLIDLIKVSKNIGSECVGIDT